MKKFTIVFLILLTTSALVRANEDAFYTALQGCTKYSSSGETTTDGVVAKFKTQILGWENNTCVYKESVNFAGIEACTTCRLTQRQIDELVDVMRAYSTVQKHSNEKTDLSSFSKVQGNPIVNAWNKYLMDSSVCTIELSK